MVSLTQKRELPDWFIFTHPSNLCQESPKRLKDTEAEGDSAVDGNKSNVEAKLNDVAGPDSEVQENAREGGQQTADKVTHTCWGNIQI